MGPNSTVEAHKYKLRERNHPFCELQILGHFIFWKHILSWIPGTPLQLVTKKNNFDPKGRGGSANYPREV